jgi:hypothetical protein
VGYRAKISDGDFDCFFYAKFRYFPISQIEPGINSHVMDYE